mgnify:FL=1
MNQYRVKGLSCANCAKNLEEEIQKLEYGENAKLNFQSSKLYVNEEINMAKVKKILASDGAYIEEENKHEDTHSYLLWLVLLSVLAFIAAVVFEKTLSPSASVTMYIIATVISGYKTFLKGAKNLVRLKFNIDTLMTIALIGAFGIGEWKEGAVVAILFGVNEYLEGLGMEKARRSIESLLEVAPNEATIVIDGQEKKVSIHDIKAGDIVLVKAGEKIPSDGIVVEGKSSVNEAAITGESLPVEKEAKDEVFGGSINNEGILKVRITKPYEESSLAKILHLVEEAQETKTPTEQFINKFAKYYTPLIMLISLVVIFIPSLFLGVDWRTSLYQGLAVLIVGCPCALVLSSPIAIVSGITRNARKGILVKGGVYLEQLGKIGIIAFDKTGTLTKGEPYVEKFVEYDPSFWSIIGSIEKSSTHPIAKAIMKKIDELNVSLLEARSVVATSGEGIKAEIDGKEYRVGNEKTIQHLSLSENVKEDIKAFKQEGLTIVLVSDDKNVLGMVGIADEIRQESSQVIRMLHRTGVKRTVMLTGDHEKTAEKVAKKVGLSEYFANLLPEEKVEKVKELSLSGKTAMIGDGINDAPALAAADLGIAMGKGTDSAIETADIVLMQDHLGKLPEAISTAKKVNRIIKLNIGIALGLKAAALLLTIPGWLTLWIAILSDMGATVLVTLISLTILWERNKKLLNEAFS